MRNARRPLIAILALAAFLAGGAVPTAADVSPAVPVAADPDRAGLASRFADLLGADTGAAGTTVGQLPAIASGAEALRAVRDGRAALALVPLSALGRVSSLFAVDQIPFIAGANGEHGAHLVEAARPLLEMRLEEDGLALLALLPGAPVVLWLDRPDDPDLGRHRITPGSAAERRAAELLTFEIVGATGAATVPRARFAAEAAATETGPGNVETARAAFAYRPVIALVGHRARLEALPTGPRLSVDTAARALERHASAATPARSAVGGWWRPEFAATGQRMAEEWAIATGADGHAILDQFRRGLRP